MDMTLIIINVRACEKVVEIDSASTAIVKLTSLVLEAVSRLAFAFRFHSRINTVTVTQPRFPISLSRRFIKL